jgi:hypothetical protein
MSLSNTKRSSRKAKSCPPDLFTWQRDTELLTNPAVRAVARRTNISPALALVVAELAGLTREVRHD